MGGLTWSGWRRLLRQIPGSIPANCWARAMAINSQSLQNSIFHQMDQRQLGTDLARVQIAPPIFILGHWRQGTTHLHNLLATDLRFGFPNNYQALFPSTFLTAERLHSRAVDFLLPKRRPMDNVEWTMRSPQEDEFAICIASFLSPCMSWVLPQRRDYYDRYLTMEGVSAVEVGQWRQTLSEFLKKLTWKIRRPLVLKSPPHTARIRLLLDLFPGAKFIHIHRHPYQVFPSARRTFAVNLELHRLQALEWDDFDDWTLLQYSRMYDAFFAERSLIPAGQFYEIGFAQLEADPIGALEQLYRVLGLPDFAAARPAAERYVSTVEGYQKNSYPNLPDPLRRRIAREWQRSFHEWHYRE
jgi:hypothetical protein